MKSKTLGRAAAAAGLLALLLPAAASASWWDGGYDGRNQSGYDGRRGDSDRRPDSDRSPGYGEREEAPPSDGGPPPAENQPPQDNRAPGCGQQGCEYTPPSERCDQPNCDSPPPPSQCGQQGCEYTPPSERCDQPNCDSPPPPSQCGQQGCEYTPPSERCDQPNCDAPPPPPPPCGQPACAQAPPPPPPPPPPLFEPIYGCENSTLPDTAFALHKTTTPPPGTPVRPGDEILVDITWNVWEYAGPDLHKAIDCVYINGLFVPELSGGERPTPNDGHFAFHYYVPLNVPPGSEICDQGFVSGPQGWEEYARSVSNVVCFPVDVPPPPPPPPASCCTPPAEETPPPDDVQLDTESERVSQEEQPPAAVLPEAHEVLPRTGSGPTAARLAAAGLGLVTLIRRRTRRG